jgi:CRISPR-associated protein Cas2
MIIISYDIADDHLRTRFSKYLKRFGHRIQYSVFEIKNSNRILDNIMNDIANRFEKQFTQSDSVFIFNLSSSCEIVKYGYAKNEDDDIIIV